MSMAGFEMMTPEYQAMAPEYHSLSDKPDFMYLSVNDNDTTIVRLLHKPVLIRKTYKDKPDRPVARFVMCVIDKTNKSNQRVRILETGITIVRFMSDYVASRKIVQVVSDWPEWWIRVNRADDGRTFHTVGASGSGIGNRFTKEETSLIAQSRYNEDWVRSAYSESIPTDPLAFLTDLRGRSAAYQVDQKFLSPIDGSKTILLEVVRDAISNTEDPDLDEFWDGYQPQEA